MSFHIERIEHPDIEYICRTGEAPPAGPCRQRTTEEPEQDDEYVVEVRLIFGFWQSPAVDLDIAEERARAAAQDWVESARLSMHRFGHRPGVNNPTIDEICVERV